MNWNHQRGILDVDAMPVAIVKSPEELTSLGVEFGATSNWSVPLIGTQQPVQILQRRPTRLKAVIYVASLVTVAGQTVAPATGVIAAGAGSAALPNNTAQSVTGFTLSFSAAPSTAGTAVLSNVQGGPFTFNIPSGQTSPYTVTFPTPIQSTGAPTLTIAGLGTGAGTIELFSSGITAVSASGLALAYRPDFLANPNNPQGYIISSAPHIFQWENQQPCYAAAIGAGPVIVNTVDQAQASAQAQAEEQVQAREFERPEDQEESGDERIRTTANLY